MADIIYTLIALLLVHFIADFVCQTEKMALGKSKSLYWLSAHVIMYTSIFTCSMLLVMPHVVVAKVFPFILVNGAAHWVTDFFTSKLNSYLFNKHPSPAHHWFFVGVGIDQFIHGATILLTYDYFILN